MADETQPTGLPQEVVSPEVDPYSPEGEFVQWIKDVNVGDGKYEALSDSALREELEGDLANPDIDQQDREIVVSALGTLKVQEHSNRRLPGYAQAKGDLQGMIRNTLWQHHQNIEQGKGASPNQFQT